MASWDFAEIHSAQPAIIVNPKTESEIIEALDKYPNYRICLAGGQYSHGGQTLLDQSLTLDFKSFNQIIGFDYRNRLITVQSGITWNKIINFLDQYNLSVSEMQSYSNFTVGGSIGVNCHGRGMLYGTLADSIVELRLLTVDGKIYVASLQKYPDLFRSVIGGYGGIAIILEATLKCTDNYPIERRVNLMPYQSFRNFSKTFDDPDLVFYNSNIYPTKPETIVNICWFKTNRKLTTLDRVQVQNSTNYLKMLAEQFLRRTEFVKYLRAYFEPRLLSNPSIVWRNYEMTNDVTQLQPLFKYPTTTILQEYFVAPDRLIDFLTYFWSLMKSFGVNILNVSLRYVKSTNIPILNYAPEDRMAIVLYINIGNNQESIAYAKIWTQLLIQMAINFSGSYYLPYLPFATLKQFQLAYKDSDAYLKIKRKYDPTNRLSSHFLETYLCHKEIK
jgi:FAD/FMN-containing dehydrogenase